MSRLKDLKNSLKEFSKEDGVGLENESGQALVVVVSIVSVAFLAIAVSISLGLLNVYRSQSISDSLRAFYGAESGVAEAVSQLNINPNYSGGSLELGEVLVDISVGSGDTGYVINSSGNLGGKTRQLQVEVVEGALGWEALSWSEVY